MSSMSLARNALTFRFVNSLIRRLRPDLCAAYPCRTLEDKARWLGWLVTSGIREYAILKQLPDFHSLLQTRLDNGLTLLQWVIYHMRPDVQAAYPLQPDPGPFLAWFARHGVHEYDLDFLTTSSSTTDDSASIETLPFGVNLIGYAYGQLGIGEDLRMTARALEKVNVPFTIINFPPGKDIPQNDRSVLSYVSDAPRYAINLFCLTALEQARFVVERGMETMKGRLNIGYWPWELAKWPREWSDLTRFVDEVWVASRHIYDSLAPVSPVPVLIMPLAVDVGDVRQMPDRKKTRLAFGLPFSATLFCFSFDFNSSMARKNPQGAVKAFTIAFPKEQFTAEQVGLVIKAHKPKQHYAAWDALKELANRDDRIHVIEDTLKRDELLALYHACDCFVSLHRAEGFGRGIAEALLLGLHVIATNYSGNIDYCRPPFVDLIDYSLIPLAEGDYPYWYGQVWADPDLMHAARAMRQFVSKKQSGHLPRSDWPEFSLQQTGLRYRQRLEFLYRSKRSSSCP